MGVSKATINLDGTLNANVSGVSFLEYVGEPILGTNNTSGSSIKKKELTILIKKKLISSNSIWSTKTILNCSLRAIINT